MILSSSEEEALNHGGMPGSPPDLSLTSSKSSKSSSYQSDDNSILADAAHFEDIGLGDDAGDREILDFVEELPNPYSATYTTDLRALKRPAPRSKPSPIMQRELTSVKTRPSFPSLRGHVRSVSGDVHGLGLKPATIMSRRGFTSPSTPTLAMTGRRNRSPSPVTSPMSPHTLSTPRFGSSSHIRRGSWQSNRERKTAEELERECDEEDGDDVPDDCLLENVPISPRPPHERALSMPVSPDQPKKEKLKPAGNGTPPIPIAHGSLKSPSSPAKPSMGHRGRSMGQFPIKYDGFARQPRVKSWTVALSELSEEAKALTEALEAHSDEKPLVMKVRSQSSHRKSSIEKQRVKSTMAELPPLRKSNIMIDPLPISKEKEAVLSRTRPSWLPPKDPSEEKRHLREYQRIMALSADADRKREAAGRARMVHKDDTASSLLRIWEEHVLPNWDMATSQKRTRELWWRGIAPRSRGTVWQRAIGNELGLSEASYHAALSRAKELEKKLASGHGNEEDKRKGEWFKTIRRSVCRTYSDLRIFQPGGPLYEVLVDVLMAYVVYRSDVGYVEGVNVSLFLIPISCFILWGQAPKHPTSLRSK